MAAPAWFLFLTLAVAIAEADAGFAATDVFDQVRDYYAPDSCDYLSVGLGSAGGTAMLEVLSKVGHGTLQFSSFEMVPDRMEQFHRSKCLVVVAGGVSTRADVTTAVETVAGIWHRKKVLVLLADVPVVTKMLVDSGVGFKTVLLTPDKYEVLATGQEGSNLDFYSKPQRILEGMHLRVTAPIVPPFAVTKVTTDPATGEPVVRVVGVDVFILDMLARNFKFTYEVSPAKTFDVYTLPNGTKIGGVSSGVADLAISQTSVVYHRYQMIDYLPPMQQYDLRLMRTLPKEVISYATLFWPFSPLLWAFVVASIAGMAAVLIIIERVSSNENDDYIYQAISLSYVPMIQESLLRSWFTYCTRFLSTTVVLYLWLLGGYLLTLAYKSQLKAMMMTIKYEDTIDTFDDLLNSEGNMLILPRGTMLYAGLAMDPKAVSQRVFKERTVLYNWGDGVSEEMQKKLDDGTYLEFQVASARKRKEFADKHVSRHVLYFYHSAWYVRKGNPLKMALWRPIRRLRESGILNKAFWDSLDLKPDIPLPKLRVNKPLVVWQYVPCFFLVALGTVVSTISVNVEMKLGCHRNGF